MILSNTSMNNIIKNIEHKTFICFGAGNQLLSACNDYADIGLFDKIDYIIDNDSNKKTFYYNNKVKAVNTIDECLIYAINEIVILVTVLDCIDIIMQLNSYTELDKCVCYIYSFVLNYVEAYQLPIRTKSDIQRIPKTIHYCWFGGNTMPDSYQANIESWKKYCPDYNIIQWNESNYDITKNRYMLDAYKQHKWGFVSDFARLDIIFNHGGIYFDTDVEIITNIDYFLYDEAFCGFGSRSFVNNGSGFGAIAGFHLLAEQIDIYKKTNFISTGGSMNIKTGPLYQTEYLATKKLILNDTLQNIEGMVIYPSDVFSPLKLNTGLLDITENTYAIHHFSGSWLDDTHKDTYASYIEKFNVIKKLIYG